MGYDQIKSDLTRNAQRRKYFEEQLANTHQAPQMVSGRTVPTGPVSGIARIAKLIIDKQNLDAAGKKEEELNAEFDQGREKAFSNVTDAYFGKEATPLTDMSGNEMAGPLEESNMGVEANPVKAAMMAMQDPYLKDSGMGRQLLAGQTGGSNGGNPYNSFLYGPSGEILVGNNRTGEVSPTDYISGKYNPQTAYDTSKSKTSASQEVKGATEPEIQKNIAMQKVYGDSQANALLDLPATERKAAETVRLVDELINHPGFEDAVGFWDNPLVLGGLVPGTEASGFKKRLAQLEGRTFMEIFPTLKGGGQITEIEGTKGQDAINRMSVATTEPEFRKAAMAFKEEVNRLRNIVKNKAGVKVEPSSDAPDGVTAEEWSVMSDEDKALFK